MSLNIGRLPSSRREQVANLLREAILKGDLKPDDKLKETELSEKIGVSRGPIREALRQLEQEGYVISYPYKGTVVAHFNDEEVTEILIPIRNILENYALKKVIEKDLDTHIEKLEYYTAKMHDGLINNDVSKIIENNLLFHEYLVTASDSSTLEQIWKSIMSRIRHHFYNLGKIQNKEELYKDITEHNQIIDALKSKEVDDALQLLSKHIK